MIATVKVLENFKEIEKYHNAIEEHGEVEAFNLGLFTSPPVEKFIKSEFIFDVTDVSVAWIFHDKGDKMINIQMINNNAWGLCYTDELWESLKEFLNKKKEE